MVLEDTALCDTIVVRSRFVAMGDCVKETLFVRGVQKFVQPTLGTFCIRVYENNKGAIALAENPLSSARTKNIDVRHHFLR